MLRANNGRCAARSRWYWGLKMYLLATLEGMPEDWCLAGPKLGEREVAAELLAHARDTGSLQPGMIVLADNGLAGREMERYAADQIGVLLARPGPQGRAAPFRQPGRDVQVDRGHVRHPQRPVRPGTSPRPPPQPGLRPHRQRVLALAACIWHNCRTTTTVGKRSLVGYDH